MLINQLKNIFSQATNSIEKHGLVSVILALGLTEWYEKDFEEKMTKKLIT